MHKNLRKWYFLQYFFLCSIVVILYYPISHHQHLRKPGISLTAKNINTKELDEGKTCRDPERQIPTVLNVKVILRAARSAHVIGLLPCWQLSSLASWWMSYVNYCVHLTDISATGFYCWCCSCAFFHNKTSLCAALSLSLGRIILRTFAQWLNSNTIYF